VVRREAGAFAPVLTMVPYRSCIELLAVTFGDTIIDVAQVDAYAPIYRIGEGEGVRVPVSGDGLPDPAGFALVWAGAGGFWLAFCPSMRGVIIDHRGQRSLVQLVAEGRAIAADGAHHILLEEGETIWVEHQSVRFRARLVAREAVRASKCTIDRPYLGSLSVSALVVLVFLMLARAQPAPIVDEDEHRAVLARLLELEPVPPEPVPGPPTETERSLEQEPETRAATSTPLPHPPDPRPRSSKRKGALWAPASPAQAVGQLGRNYDPVAAARRAGIFGVLGDRRFITDERVFDPQSPDAAVWASASDVSSTWMTTFGHDGGRPRRWGAMGEGVVGRGSYGRYGTMDEFHDLRVEDHELTALCSGDCRRPVRPRPTIVRFGDVVVEGTLDRDVARRVARAHITELRRCFERTIAEPTAEFAGNIEFALVRDSVGTIVIDPAFPDELAECMKRSVRHWHFPRDWNPTTSLVSVSLRLSR
jgi:hypothetical protein